jgi:hypothetical protein
VSRTAVAVPDLELAEAAELERLQTRDREKSMLFFAAIAERSSTVSQKCHEILDA